MAGAKQGMVPGFNHNVKHRVKTFHVQTEDSGLANPQIVTHLFAGGNILASKKIFYGDISEAENLIAIVRELMEEQHKDVLRSLVHGVYDDEAQALAPEGKVYQPGELAAPGPAQPAAAPAPPAAAPASPLATAPASPRPAQLPPPLPRARAVAARPPAAPSPLPPSVSPPSVSPPSVSPPSVSPPSVSPPSVSPPSAASPSASPPVAAAVPAAQRGEVSEPLFGEDLVNEKSLDEVILSYLAGDRDAKK